METPNTQAGRITERIMVRIIQKTGPLKTHQYNQVYSGVFEALTLEFPPDSGVVKYPQGGGMFINRK